MSSQASKGGDAQKPSPAGSDVPDMYALMSESSNNLRKAAFWIGVLIGLWFILGAYQTSDDLSEVESMADLIPTWHDWVWVGLAGLGAVVSFIVSAHLMAKRKPGNLPYDMIAAIGGAVSVVVVIVMMMEHIDSFRSLVSPDGSELWPGAKPLWFLPLSALGVTLPMVSLVLARGGDVRDGVLGMFLSCSPVIVLSLPAVLALDDADIVRWIPTIYFVAGVSLVFAGFRPFQRSSEVLLESMDSLAPKVLAGTLVLAGLASWLMVSDDEGLTSSMDFVWILPLVVNLALSVSLFAAARNTLAAEAGWTQGPAVAGRKGAVTWLQVLSLSGAVISLVLLSSLAMSYLDEVAYSAYPMAPTTMLRSIWLYPLSMIGATLVMVSVNLVGPGTRLDRISGLLYASLPTVVTASFASAWYLLSRPELSHPLLAERAALLVFFGFAASVLVSGMRIETFVKAQWPVLREKAALNNKKYRQVMRQVMKNPMGVIGICILLVFFVIAIIGPSIAPYEVDMTINGPFEKLMPESSEHWMGTDTFRHDIFSQLLYGARTSITVGVVAAVISSVLGAAIGLYSGYVGGWKDEAIMRLNDIVLSIPWLVLMIIIAAFMGSIDLVGIILVIGLTGWSGTARLVRAQVLSLRERQYIERARAIGSDDIHIITTHILPNAFPLVFANTILTVAGSILAEATLSFLGLEPYGVVTWGTMLSYAQEAGAFTIGLHWWIIAPGVCIVLVVLGFTLLGYALDDVMNPKLRKR